MKASLTTQEAQMLDMIESIAKALEVRIEGWQYVIPFDAITLEELKCLKHAIIDADRGVVYVPIIEEGSPFSEAEFDKSQDEMRP